MWESRDERIVCGDQGFELALHRERLMQGLRIGQSDDGVCFAVESQVPLQTQDVYLRQNDVVASFWSADKESVRLEVYWRRLPVPETHVATQVACVELLVSVQTRLLDVTPQVSVLSSFPAGEVNEPAHEFSVVGQNSDFRMVQMVQPSDFAACSADVTDSNQVVLCHKLFGQTMERGVIRRARLRAVITQASMSPEMTASLVAATHQQLATTTPSLTT